MSKPHAEEHFRNFGFMGAMNERGATQTLHGDGMTGPCLTIVVPTYQQHFRFATALLDSIARHALDPEMVKVILVVEQENRAFVEAMQARSDRLQIEWCSTEQIMKDLSIDGTSADLLRHAGKFSFQSIKKIGGMLKATTQWVLVMDSESLFLKDFSARELLEDYRQRKYVFFTRVADRGPACWGSLGEVVTVNAVELVGGRTDVWYTEYYHWFYERDVWSDIVSLIKSNGGFDRWMRQGNVHDVFENVLYYQYVSTRPALGYVYHDTLEIFGRHLPKLIVERAKLALLGSLQVVGLLEHVTSLVSMKELPSLEPLFDAFALPFIRVEPYTIDPRVIETVGRFSSVTALVSSHRSRVMRNRVAVCISGEFRSVHSNIRSIRDMTSGVACDLFVHSWNSPAVPAIADGLAPAALLIEDAPDFDDVTSRISKPEPFRKDDRDTGSLRMFHGIAASIAAIRERTEQYDLVVRVRPDTVFQEALRDLIMMIADDETYDDDTVYVPDRFHSQGINDQFAIGSIGAMLRYGQVLDYAIAHVEDEYFNPEHLMALHLLAQGLRLKTMPMQYLLLRSEARDINRLGQITQNQDSIWWSSILPGPSQIRTATEFFKQKAKAMILMQDQDRFGDWTMVVSATHLASPAKWHEPYIKINVRHEYKNPEVVLVVAGAHERESELFVEVKADGLALVSHRPAGILFVQAGALARELKLVRFMEDLEKTAAVVDLSIVDPAQVGEVGHLMPDRLHGNEPVAVGAGLDLMRRFLVPEASERVGFWRSMRARFALSRGRRQRRMGDLAAARLSYARMLSLDPGRVREWVQYGHVLKDLGEPNQAMAAYAMALTLKPGDADAEAFHESVSRLIAQG